METKIKIIFYLLLVILSMQFRCVPAKKSIYFKNSSKNAIFLLNKKKSNDFEKAIKPYDSLKIARNEYELDFYLDSTQKQYQFYIADIHEKTIDSIFMNRFDLKENEVIIYLDKTNNY